MSIEEIITSGLLEKYVLGTANADETALIQSLCKTHPELVKEIEYIEDSLMSYSEQLAPPLNNELKNSILSQLPLQTKNQTDTKVVNVNKNQATIKLYQLGMAASLLLFVSSFIYAILLQQKLNKVNSELVQLSETKIYMANALKIQQTNNQTLNFKVQVITNPKFKPIVLNGMNFLVQKTALIYWNAQTEELYFNANNLPKSPNQKQYQLWAIVNGKPVDAGLVDATDSDSIFQKMKLVKGAQAFAVTIEPLGGNVSPSLQTMCLLGNV